MTIVPRTSTRRARRSLPLGLGQAVARVVPGSSNDRFDLTLQAGPFSMKVSFPSPRVGNPMQAVREVMEIGIQGAAQLGAKLAPIICAAAEAHGRGVGASTIEKLLEDRSVLESAAGHHGGQSGAQMAEVLVKSGALDGAAGQHGGQSGAQMAEVLVKSGALDGAAAQHGGQSGAQMAEVLVKSGALNGAAAEHGGQSGAQMAEVLVKSGALNGAAAEHGGHSGAQMAEVLVKSGALPSAAREHGMGAATGGLSCAGSMIATAAGYGSRKKAVEPPEPR